MPHERCSNLADGQCLRGTNWEIHAHQKDQIGIYIWPIRKGDVQAFSFFLILGR